jgi:S-adenosylmethionine hydrolase
MGIFLFTDFGAADIYVGQVKAVLAREAPANAIIDLLHEAPAFNVRAGAHLLAALASQIPAGSVTLAVVDPGVGGDRAAVALEVDGRWFVGPDNGLMSGAGRAGRENNGLAHYVAAGKPRALVSRARFVRAGRGSARARGIPRWQGSEGRPPAG